MTSEREKKKREIFESMSSRRQQKILKKGYEKWDPFLEPKEPPFFREEERERARQAAELLDGFLRERQEQRGAPEPLDPLYVEGARAICLGLVKDRDVRCQGMFDFCAWYRRRMEGKEGEGTSS